MRGLALVLVAACSFGAKKSATTPVSVLEQQRRLDEPAENAQRRENSLASEPAVRHRALSWQDISTVVASADDLASSPSAPVAQQLASPEARPEKLVVELWLEVRVGDVGKIVDEVTTRVVAAGGRVVSSNVVGADTAASSAALELRVPPARAPDLAGWLEHSGALESKRTLGTDVSKQLVDQALELENLHVTMDRLEKLSSRDLPLADVLSVEKEMTRVRGEIERVEGEQRWLNDRVDLATINVSLSHEGGPIELAKARVYPGARLAAMTLIDPGMRKATRLGGGGSLQISRLLTFDLEVFPRETNDSRAVFATVGSALYSGYFGGGYREWLNPYLGARLGYGYISGEGGVAIAGELGVEVYKREQFLIELALRTFAVARDSATDTGFESVFGAAVPF